MRFKGQSYELTVPVRGADRERIEQSFREAYAERYGSLPSDRAIEIVTLRLRRVGRVAEIKLPALEPDTMPITSGVCTRAQLLAAGPVSGAMLLTDDQSTTYIPDGWRAQCEPRGIVTLTRESP